MCFRLSLSDIFSNPPNSGVAKAPSAPAIDGPALKTERPFEFAFKVQVFCEGQKQTWRLGVILHLDLIRV